MKRFIFPLLLVLFLFSAGSLLAQNDDKNSRVQSEWLINHNLFEKTNEVFRVVNPLDWAGVAIGATDTVVASNDTLSRKLVSTSSNTLATTFTKYVKLSIFVTDTVQISTDAAHTKPIIVFPTTTSWHDLGAFFTGDITNFYIKRYVRSGETGTPEYFLKATGF